MCVYINTEYWSEYSFKSIGIVTECISDHNDTNKHNDCRND